MCCGSAARRRFGAADHALAQVRPRQMFETYDSTTSRLSAILDNSDSTMKILSRGHP